MGGFGLWQIEDKWGITSNVIRSTRVYPRSNKRWVREASCRITRLSNFSRSLLGCLVLEVVFILSIWKKYFVGSWSLVVRTLGTENKQRLQTYQGSQSNYSTYLWCVPYACSMNTVGVHLRHYKHFLYQYNCLDLGHDLHVLQQDLKILHLWKNQYWYGFLERNPKKSSHEFL